jgi:hypothetical protein
MARKLRGKDVRNEENKCSRRNAPHIIQGNGANFVPGNQITCKSKHFTSTWNRIACKNKTLTIVQCHLEVRSAGFDAAVLHTKFHASPTFSTK